MTILIFQISIIMTFRSLEMEAATVLQKRHTSGCKNAPTLHKRHT